MVDIKDYPKVIEAINGIINNRGVAEVKIEKWDVGKMITVVEQTRQLKATVEKNEED